MGTLYLVATPIGNLEDITFRALTTLREVDLIAAEDTRHSGKLLKHFDISTRMISYHGHSGEGRLKQIIDALGSGDVAVISDAGTPGISDPGIELIRAAIDRNFAVVVIPGASAVTAAAAVSGLVDSGFLFAGFPPRKPGQRREFLQRMGSLGFPVVLYESPHRINATLDDLVAVYPDADVALCRELTKLYEEVVRGTTTEVRETMQKSPPRGEVALVFRKEASKEPMNIPDDARALARQLLDRGLSASRAAKELAMLTGMSRSNSYALLLELREELQ